MEALTGKVVVLTGASAGIGKALALALAPQRPRLVLAARDEAQLAQVAEACRGKGAEVLVVPTDVSHADHCQRLVTRAVGQCGGIDVLINNAGIGMIASFEDVQDLAVFERLMKVNYLGCVYLTYYALPELKKSRGASPSWPASPASPACPLAPATPPASTPSSASSIPCGWSSCRRG